MVRFPQKLQIPSTARPLIERLPQLAQLTQVITSHRATMLISPAGWGKTTTLAQWASSAPLPIAWYSLGNADRDPYELMSYLLAAVAPLVPEAGVQAEQLRYAQPHELADLLRDCAAVIANAQRPFALILDDLHLISDVTDPDAAEAVALAMDFLAMLIDYAPHCHLVLASRTLPRRLPGLIRQIAQQRVAVLDYLALQWGAEDIQRLAQLHHMGALSPPQAADLAEHYNGWVMGISLALDHKTVPGGAARTLGGPDDSSQVYAFLAEQVIAPLPADLQRFLEDTSVLDDLSAARCNQLCGRTDAALIFEELIARGLFLSRRGSWLSYHSLFRSFLRARLASDPPRERAMLRQAGAIYAADDELERAVTCYCAIAEWGLIHQLLRAAVPRFRQRAQQATLLRCFDQLQEATRPRNIAPPDLLLAQARVYSDLALWERANVALDLIESLGSQAERWEARILRADLLSIQGDRAGARASLDSIPPIEALPAHLHLAARYTASRLAILEGQIDQATDLLKAALDQASPDAEAAARPETMAAVYDLLGYGYGLQQQTTAALRCLQRADAYWQISGDGGRRALTLNNIGVLALEEGRLADARSALTTALSLAQDTAQRRSETASRLSLADLELVEGQLAAAQAQFAAAHGLALRTQVGVDQGDALCGAAWVAALSGDMAAAHAWLLRLSPGEECSAIAQGRHALTRAYLLRADNAPASAWAGPLAEAQIRRAALGPSERAALALGEAQAMVATPQGATAANWQVLDTALSGLAEPLLHILIDPYRALVARAPAGALLARRNRQPISAEQPHWQISALGGFACVADGQQSDLSPLHRTLIVRLLDAGPAGLDAERLWEDIWDDLVFSSGALRKAISRLREQTGLAIAVRGGHFAIRSSWSAIDYDVQRFERALAEPPSPASWQRMIDLYHGDFLPGALPSAASWVDGRRTYLQQRYLSALELLAQSFEPSEPEQAISLYQRVLQDDRCREQTAARLMNLAARLGNHALVSTTFEQLNDALQALGVTPLPSTASLFQHLR